MLNSSEHFVPYDRLPVVPDDNALSVAFRTMSRAGSGALVVRTGLRPVWYVAGAWLKEAYRRLYESELPGTENPSLVPIRDLLDPGHPISEEASGDLLGEDGQLPRTGPVAISGAVSEEADAAPLRNRREAVLLVTDQQDQPVGWFLNHEHILASLGSPPPEFVCENGHRNTDPDSGRCYSCPAPITG